MDSRRWKTRQWKDNVFRSVTIKWWVDQGQFMIKTQAQIGLHGLRQSMQFHMRSRHGTYVHFISRVFSCRGEFWTCTFLPEDVFSEVLRIRYDGVFAPLFMPFFIVGRAFTSPSGEFSPSDFALSIWVLRAYIHEFAYERVGRNAS